MDGYTPRYALTDEIMGLVASICERVSSISALHKLDGRPHLRRANRIRSVHASLRIEANSLSLTQVRDVIDGKAVLGERREIQEVKNAYDAYGQLAQIDPYSMDDLRRMHGVMMRALGDGAGAFRSGDEGVFRGGELIFLAPPGWLVDHHMCALFAWLGEARAAVHPLILACVFHYEFVFIHPFSDGNGRMARLWHSAILAKWRPIFEFIPIESRIERFQEEYYAAIARCHAEGASTAFIAFMLRMIDGTLAEIAASGAWEGERVSPQVRRLIDVMDAGAAYSSAELMAMLSLHSREGFRRQYLRPALGAGLIRMTLPDKPNSRNQRYVRV